jgi:hypothetical protein
MHDFTIQRSKGIMLLTGGVSCKSICLRTPSSAAWHPRVQLDRLVGLPMYDTCRRLNDQTQLRLIQLAISVVPRLANRQTAQ